jgi:hypothetical protein
MEIAEIVVAVSCRGRRFGRIVADGARGHGVGWIEECVGAGASWTAVGSIKEVGGRET